jgi:serine/threonine protein kinase
LGADREDMIDLLKRMFIKDPVQRCTIADIRTHAYTTRRNTYTLVSTEDNLKSMVGHITDADLNNAVSFGFWAKIISKMKQRIRTLSSRTLSLKELGAALSGSSSSISAKTTSPKQDTTTANDDDDDTKKPIFNI